MEVHLLIQHPVRQVQVVIVQIIILIQVTTQQEVQEDQLMQQRAKVLIIEVQKVQLQNLRHQG